MFRGQYTYNVDTKCRVSIPSKLRKQVSSEASDTFVMTRSISPCIDVYPLDEWQRFEERLKRLNPYKGNEDKFIRIITRNASDDTMDSQSRILVPKHLLEYAGIEKEVLIIGALRKIELWNPQKYEDYMQDAENNYAEIAAEVMAP